MNKKSKITIFTLAIICLLALPFIVNAALVPCGGHDGTPEKCQLCHFLILIRNIVDFILKAIVPLAALFVMAGGIMILVSRGGQMAIQGKKMITYAVIGIIIALVSWTIVNTIIVALVNTDEFPTPWNAWELDCPIINIPLEEPALITSYELINDTSIPIQYSKNNNSLIDKILKIFTKESLAQITPGVSPGDTIRYTATYTDISTVDLSNLIITIDYDQDLISSLPTISAGGIDDGSEISWDLGDLNIQQSVTVYFDFILISDINTLLQNAHNNKEKSLFQTIREILDPIIKKASGQISPITIIRYQNTISISSNEAEPESMDDPLEITISSGLFAERQYYLIADINNDDQPGPGDKIRYTIKYHNPMPFPFPNTIIISDYDQSSITITNIDGGGVDDGDRITWNLGNLAEEEPPANNPGCIGYEFTITSGGTISNVFYVISDGGILETSDDELIGN